MSTCYLLQQTPTSLGQETRKLKLNQQQCEGIRTLLEVGHVPFICEDRKVNLSLASKRENDANPTRRHVQHMQKR